MNLRHTVFCIVAVFFLTIAGGVSADEMWDPEGTLVTRMVHQSGAPRACVVATLADQRHTPRARLPRYLRTSCTDEEIVALMRGCVATSVDSVECAIGRRLHVSVTNEGVVNDIYLVDDTTGAYDPTGRVRN